MKYCPHLECPHRRNTGSPAELLDRVVVCPDCGSALVEDPVLAEAGVAPVTEAGGYRESAQLPLAVDPRETARADVNVGAAIMAISVVVPGLTYAASGMLLPVIAAVVPLFYGIQRLERGLRARGRQAKGGES